MSMLPLVGIIALTIPAVTAPALADAWRGPLPVENERPWQAIFLHLPAQNPDVLPRGVTSLGAQLDVANNLLTPGPGPRGATVTEDFETQRLKLSWRKGWGRAREIGITTNLTARNGGVLDAPIELYHRLLGLAGDGPDNPTGRDDLPRGRSILAFRNAAGQGVNAGNAVGLGDTTFVLKQQLARGRFATAVRVAIKAPSGSRQKLLGSGGFDAGLTFDGRYQCASRWSLFGSAGAAKFGASTIPGTRGSGWQSGLGLEWRVGQRSSIVAQLDAAARGVTTGNPFADRTPVIASVGFKKQLNARRVFWVSFSENGDYHNYHAPLFGNIGPDLTLSLGYEWRR